MSNQDLCHSPPQCPTSGKHLCVPLTITVYDVLTYHHLRFWASYLRCVSGGEGPGPLSWRLLMSHDVKQRTDPEMGILNGFGCQVPKTAEDEARSVKNQKCLELER